MAGLTGQLTKAFEGAAHAATEAMVGARTVAAFGLQATMLAKFDAAMQTSTNLGLRRARFGGLGQGASQFMMFAVVSERNERSVRALFPDVALTPLIRDLVRSRARTLPARSTRCASGQGPSGSSRAS